ncbi:DUF2946 family protein [Rouxiella sp. WC2420]|uniref:DUF2946 family protein n=1 Tax=Rouxiella sp. WC2420 TaxID=3234145 RepID=A0AB39VUK6_9GAMM
MSLILINSSRSFSPAWWGIFAILIVLFAPAISRSLEHFTLGAAKTSATTDSMASFVSGADRVIATGMKDHQSSISEQLGRMQMQLNASANDVSMHEDLSYSYCALIDQMAIISLGNVMLQLSGNLRAFIPREHFDSPLFSFFKQAEFQPRAPPF